MAYLEELLLKKVPQTLRKLCPDPSLHQKFHDSWGENKFPKPYGSAETPPLEDFHDQPKENLRASLTQSNSSPNQTKCQPNQG